MNEPHSGQEDSGRRGSPSSRHPLAQNIILLIGDGMGAAHRLAGQLLSAGRAGRLVMDSLPHSGQMSTLSLDPETFVTDSAAAATALATGFKTINGAISLDVDGCPRPTILERARAMGKATGLVTNCQITDATPAGFAAHVPHRSEQSEIARQYLEDSRVDVLLGGGAVHWLPLGTADTFSIKTGEPRMRNQSTSGNLVARAIQTGYSYVSDTDGLHRSSANPEIRKLLGLFAAQELFQQSLDGGHDWYNPPVSLADMTARAIEVLNRNPNGFFLMVEESAIDRMAHRNNAALTIAAVLELDRAVETALDFARTRGDTLVIVTADHECGGLAIAGSADEPYPYEPGGGLLETVLAGEDGPFPVADAHYGFVMGWATTGHTAATVPVTGVGPGANAISGEFENTHLFRIMSDALGDDANERLHATPVRRSGF